MPDCHEHPFDHTECVHGGHDWCYHCAEELQKAEREKCAEIAFYALSLGGPSQYALADEVKAKILSGKSDK